MADIEKRGTPLVAADQKQPVPAESQVSNTSSEEEIAAVRDRFLVQQDLKNTEPPVLPITTLWRKNESHDLGQTATQPSVFDNPETAKYFQPTEKYENLHRFDPNFRWTWGDELVRCLQLLRFCKILTTSQPLINKIDWKITAWACIAFFALDLDRGNLSQANTDNFLEDLNLTTNGACSSGLQYFAS